MKRYFTVVAKNAATVNERVEIFDKAIKTGTILSSPGIAPYGKAITDPVISGYAIASYMGVDSHYIILSWEDDT